MGRTVMLYSHVLESERQKVEAIPEGLKQGRLGGL
jgi:hypothetical protein